MRRADLGHLGKPDLIARGGREVAAKQIRGDWKAMATIGDAAAPGLGHDGSNAMVAHLPHDPAAACTRRLRSELDMNPRAAIASMAVAINQLDVRQQDAIGNGSRAFRTRLPRVVAGWRDLEHTAHDPHRIVGVAIFDEAEPHVRGPAKIAIDFFKMSRSMRNCWLSRCNRAKTSALAVTKSIEPGTAPRGEEVDIASWLLRSQGRYSAGRRSAHETV